MRVWPEYCFVRKAKLTWILIDVAVVRPQARRIAAIHKLLQFLQTHLSSRRGPSRGGGGGGGGSGGGAVAVSTATAAAVAADLGCVPIHFNVQLNRLDHKGLHSRHC